MSSVNIASHFNSFNSLSLSTSQFNIKSKEGKPLKIVKYEHNAKPVFCKDAYWNHYCRGLIVDIESNKIVCIPTPKGIGNNHFKEVFYEQFEVPGHTISV